MILIVEEISRQKQYTNIFVNFYSICASLQHEWVLAAGLQGQFSVFLACEIC